MILEKFTDLAGKIRIRWQDELTKNTYMFKFQSEPTLEQIQKVVNETLLIEKLSKLESFDWHFDKKEIIVDVILKFKENPDISFDEFSDYLLKENWQYNLEVKHFILTSVSKIAEKNNIDISNKTYEEVFGVFKQFIKKYTLQELTKIFLNQIDL